MTTTTNRGACPDPELFTALVDSELDRVEQDVVLDHVAACDECAQRLGAERRTRAVLVALRDEPADAAEGGPLVPSADLTARLLAIPASDGRESAPISLDQRRRRLPAYLGAAASVVVLVVGAFAFVGASAQGGGSNAPDRTTAIVPAADRLAQEHALTAVQAGFGGPGNAAGDGSTAQIVPVNLP